jgi:hypothetical protein
MGFSQTDREKQKLSQNLVGDAGVEPTAFGFGDTEKATRKIPPTYEMYISFPDSSRLLLKSPLHCLKIFFTGFHAI